MVFPFLVGVSQTMSEVQSLSAQLKSGVIDGTHLAKLVTEGKLTKSDRRKITRLAQKKEVVLSDRQKLRLESKAKKQLPRLTRDDRHQKFVVEKMEIQREKRNMRDMVCLGCRQVGHSLKYCTVSLQETSAKTLFCYNCGETNHALRNCSMPKVPGFLPFAECFLCKERGHISKDCTKNPNGLYPMGGCCHICSSKFHLVRDCPQKQQLEETSTKDEKPDLPGRTIKLGTLDDSAGGDEHVDIIEDNDEEEEPSARKSKKSKRK